jgi:vitamin B12 transporter
LQSLGVKSLEEALTVFSDIHIVNASGVQSVFTQGLGSNEVKILIDGINLKDPTTPQGTPLINRIDINFIDRIEIVTGGQSSLYGSGAMAGVINIITKKNTEKSFLLQGALPGPHSRIGFNAGQDIDGWLVTLSASTENDNAHSSIPSLTEKDAVNTKTLQIGLNKELPIGTLDLTHRQHQVLEELDYNDGFSPIYDDPDYHSTTQQNLTQAKWSLPWSNNTTTVLFTASDSARRTINSADSGLSTYSDDHYKGNIKTIDLQNRIQINPEHTLLVGLEQSHENGSFETNYNGSTSSFPNKNINTLSQYAQFECKNTLVNTLIGGRHETFGNKHVTTYDLNFSKEITPGIVARYNASSGHREPSLYEKYVEDAYTLNNPNLSAENSYSRLYSLTHSLKNISYGITYFEYDVYDKITYTTVDPMAFTSNYENVSGKTKSRGTTTHIQFSQLPYLSYLLCSYTHLNSKNPDGTKTIRTPEDQITLSAVVPLGKLTTGIILKYRGKILDSGSVSVPEYTHIDTHLSYELDPKLKATLSIYNLQDNHYLPLKSYQVAGREVLVGVTYFFN